jgi:RNA polymerase sigma-70 factor (ECF subfamily)
MLGSVVDAEDATQETMIRAWRNLDRFDGRASLRTWLYRIATNVCLDELSDRGRRARPMEEGPPGNGFMPPGGLIERPPSHWIEPIPDALALPADADPAELAMLRQSIRLAFVAALQHLAPKQRAVLLLMEVLGWSAAEVAEAIDTSVAAVNSALQRARAALAQRKQSTSAELSEPQQHLLTRYVDAFERYDIDELTGLLRQDAILSMPPYTLWIRGPEAIRTWMLGVGNGCRGSRLLPANACGSPAFGQYRPNPEGGHKPWALIVLEFSEGAISGMTYFLDTESFFPRFGLPMELPA